MNKVNRGFDPPQQITLFMVIDIADEIIRISRGEIFLMLHGKINDLDTSLFQHVAFLKINRFRAAFDEKKLVN